MKTDLRILNIQENVQQLSDKVLLEQADLITTHERGITILALRHLREIEVRRLFVDMGYSSMYECCLKRFKYSEGQTQRRLSSARLMTELPEIEKQIQSGDLNVTNLSKFQSFVRAEKAANHTLSKEDKLNLIAQCENKATRQVEKELIERSHQPALLAEKFHKTSQVLSDNPEYTKFEVLLDPAQQKLLQEFKDLYTHELQDSANVSVLKFLLDKAVQYKKKKLGLHPKKVPAKTPTQKTATTPETYSEASSAANPETTPETSPEANASLPSATKAVAIPKQTLLRKPIKISTQRLVWQRAQHCCEHREARSKVKCTSSFALQIDHIVPIAIGGSDEVSNLQLLCRAHNSRRAVKTFGVYRPPISKSEKSCSR